MVSLKQLALAALVVNVVATAEPARGEGVPRADGTAIVYHLSQVERTKRRGLLLMLQGSGCEPVAEREWVKTEPLLLAPEHTVVTIEKYGVVPSQGVAGFVDGCSSDYWSRNTLQQRVLDAAMVISRLRAERWWNRELVIYGGSEGGAVAAMLAPLLPETRAVIIVSSGIGVPVAELIRSAVPPPVASQISAMLVEAKTNPTGRKQFGGASFRWWADAADLTPAKALLQTHFPVLLIHGGHDEFAPVSTARATRDLFDAARNRNLTYREYPSYDHAMKDAAGIDHRPAVLRAASDWLRAK